VTAGQIFAKMENEPLYHENKLVANVPPEIRSGFITKVYGILTVQLILTAAVACPFVACAGLKQWVKFNGGPLVIGVCILNILFMCFMVCPCGCQKNMRTFPINYMLLAGFTITEGLLVGVICANYTVASVLMAVLATGILVFSLSLYAMTTKSDFTGMGVYLFAAMMCLMIFSLFCIFLPFPFAHKVLCCLGILVFSFYLIYDTQMVMGNGQLALGIDDYVFGALQLYIDIVQIFLYILQLIGRRD